MQLFCSEAGKMLVVRFKSLQSLAFDLRNEARDLWISSADENEQINAKNIRDICAEVLKVLINSGL